MSHISAAGKQPADEGSQIQREARPASPSAHVASRALLSGYAETASSSLIGRVTVSTGSDAARLIGAGSPSSLVSGLAPHLTTLRGFMASHPNTTAVSLKLPLKGADRQGLVEAILRDLEASHPAESQRIRDDLKGKSVIWLALERDASHPGAEVEHVLILKKLGGARGASKQVSMGWDLSSIAGTRYATPAVFSLSNQPQQLEAQTAQELALQGTAPHELLLADVVDTDGKQGAETLRVTERLQGSWQSATKTISRRQALLGFEQIAAKLEQMHQTHAHLDFKPDNIVASLAPLPDGSTGLRTVDLIDFGWSQPADAVDALKQSLHELRDASESETTALSPSSGSQPRSPEARRASNRILQRLQDNLLQGNDKFLAPEARRLWDIQNPLSDASLALIDSVDPRKMDIWALGTSILLVLKPDLLVSGLPITPSNRNPTLAVIRSLCHDPDSQALLSVASHCLELDPDQRPSAAEVVDMISQLCGIRPEHLD